MRFAGGHGRCEARADSTMLRLNGNQRAVLADKLGDAANLVAGALIVAQSLGGLPYSIPLAVTGLVLWLVLTGFALWLEAP